MSFIDSQSSAAAAYKQYGQSRTASKKKEEEEAAEAAARQKQSEAIKKALEEERIKSGYKEYGQSRTKQRVVEPTEIYYDLQAGNITPSEVPELVDKYLKSQGVTERSLITEAPEGYYYRAEDVEAYNRQAIEYNRALREYRLNLIRGITAPAPKPPAGYGTKIEKEPDALEMVFGPPRDMGPPEPTEEERRNIAAGLTAEGRIPGPWMGAKPGTIGAELQARVTSIFDTHDISSSQLWAKSREYNEEEVMKLAGILPYSPKGVYQAAGILMGSIEAVTSPIFNIIPGRQPLEVMPGEETISWRNIEQFKVELKPGALKIAQIMGITSELALSYGATFEAAYLSGKVVGAAGGLVSKVPAISGPVTQAAKYLLKPRPLTTVLIGGGLITAEGAKIMELTAEGAPAWQIGTEIGLDIVKMRAFDVGFAKGIGGTTFLESAKETFPIKYDEVSIPLAGEEERTFDWKGIYISKGDDAVFPVGKITSYYEESDSIAMGYVPKTSIESRVTLEAMKKMEYNPIYIEDIEDIRAIVSKTQNVGSKYIEDMLPTKTSTLSEKGVKTLKEFLLKNIEEVEQVYGSYATLPQLKTSVEYTITSTDKAITISALRTPGDIDIQLLTTGDEATQFAEKLAAELLKAGEQVRISEESTTLIEALVGEGQWAHAVDIHVAADVTDTLPSVRVWGFNIDKTPIKIEGFPTMSASEQGIRKATSIMGFQENYIGPLPHRWKDLPDFFQVQDTLLSSKTIPDLKTEARLETLLGRYGGMEKLIREAGASTEETMLPIIRYSYHPPSKDIYSTTAPLTTLAAPYLGIPKPVSPSPTLFSTNVPFSTTPPSIKPSTQLYDTKYKPKTPSPPISPPSPSLLLLRHLPSQLSSIPLPTKHSPSLPSKPEPREPSPPHIPEVPKYPSPPDYELPSPPSPPSIPKYPPSPSPPSYPPYTTRKPKPPSIPKYPYYPKEPPSPPSPSTIYLPTLPISEREEKRRKRRGAFEERILPLATEKQIMESVFGEKTKLRSVKI